MHQSTTGKPGSGRGAKDFHPDRPMIIRPEVNKIPVEENGLLLYIGIGKYEGKTYIAALFDAMFTRTITTVAQHRKYNTRKKDPYNF